MRLAAVRAASAAGVTVLATVRAAAEQRFPPPDFTGGYELPTPTAPQPDAAWWGLVDVGMLAIALGLATWLALVRRSRNGMVALSIGALVYFGFVREGCVCAIGSIQNVSLALADSSYAMPLAVLAFFMLPLLFALQAGRVFCAGVCPLGAIQDLVLIRPVTLPRAVDAGLGLLPYVYLGAAVLMAATGTRFIICEFDPFVGFFRLSGERGMLIFGGAMLLLAAFVGRPYCRFLCPYGVLLRHLSRFSRRHLSVTPSDCINCHLCAESCPFGAIDEPAPATVRPTPAMRRRLALLVAGLPVMMIAGGWLVASVAPQLARLHPMVEAAESAIEADTPPVNREAVVAEARSVQAAYRWGGWTLGAVLGLAVGGRLIRLSVYRPANDYTAQRPSCFSCARCVPVCPKELERRGELPVPLAVSAVSVNGATT